jgi:hypothetical protein
MRMPPPAKRGEINFPFIDCFTFVHLFIYGSFIVYGTCTRYFQGSDRNPFKAYISQIFPHTNADTWKNSVGDFMAVCLGWAMITNA